MNYLDLHAGLRCQLIHNASDNPQWVNCTVKALSYLGVAVCVDIKDEGKKTLWFEQTEVEADIKFRMAIDFSLNWQHYSGKNYHMICVANESTNKEGFERVVVFRDPETGEVYARPFEVFLQKFKPISDPLSSLPESDPILESQNAPVLVAEGVQ